MKMKFFVFTKGDLFCFPKVPLYWILLYHPHQCGATIVSVPKSTKRMPHSAKTEQRRPSGNPDRQQPVAQTGLLNFVVTGKARAKSVRLSKKCKPSKGLLPKLWNANSKTEDRIRQATMMHHQKAQFKVVTDFYKSHSRQETTDVNRGARLIH